MLVGCLIGFFIGGIIQIGVNQTRFDNFFETREEQIRKSIRPVNRRTKQISWNEYLKNCGMNIEE